LATGGVDPQVGSSWVGSFIVFDFAPTTVDADTVVLATSHILRDEHAESLVLDISPQSFEAHPAMLQLPSASSSCKRDWLVCQLYPDNDSMSGRLCLIVLYAVTMTASVTVS